MTIEVDRIAPERNDSPTREHVEARIRWVEMLRSGKYKQARSKLSTADGLARCCLGVALDPQVSGIEINFERVDDQDLGYFDGLSDYPPSGLMFEVFGLGVDPFLPDGLKLSVLNDDLGASFDEIADIIEWYFIEPWTFLLDDAA